MGLDRTLSVRPGNFAGNSKVYSAGPEGLAAQVRSLQAQAAHALVLQLGLDWSVADSSTLEGSTVVTAADFANDNILLVDGDLRVPTGHGIVISGGDVPAGLTTGVEVFVIRTANDNANFKVAATKLDAELGNAITLTDAGSGVIRIEFQIALPTPIVTFDGAGGTAAVLETSFNTNADSLLDALASASLLMDVIRTVLGMPQPGVGTLTGSLATVAAVDSTGTANGDDDDCLLFVDAQVIEQELNDAIVTIAMNVNDVAAALGIDEHIEFLSPGRGNETSDGVITDSTSASTANVDGALVSVELVELDLKLVVWAAAVGAILNRISVVSAAAQNDDDWAVNITPTQDTGGAQAPGSGLYTRQRSIG